MLTLKKGGKKVRYKKKNDGTVQLIAQTSFESKLLDLFKEKKCTVHAENGKLKVYGMLFTDDHL